MTKKTPSLSKLAPHKWAMLIAFSIVTLFYQLNSLVPPGWLSWAVTLPALLIILITAIARLDTIGQEKVSYNWQMKRMGFVLIASLALVYGLIPFGSSGMFPTWLFSGMMWGLALTWLSTPNQPPWWRFITGDYRLKKQKKR